MCTPGPCEPHLYALQCSNYFVAVAYYAACTVSTGGCSVGAIYAHLYILPDSRAWERCAVGCFFLRLFRAVFSPFGPFVLQLGFFKMSATPVMATPLLVDV